jgi:hypothetical protein
MALGISYGSQDDRAQIRRMKGHSTRRMKALIAATIIATAKGKMTPKVNVIPKTNPRMYAAR